MTEEYELAAFDRHSLNYDNVALGRLPTSVTTDPSVQPLRELSYLPQGTMDPHDLPQDISRAGKLPSEIIELGKETPSTINLKKTTQNPNQIEPNQE